MHVRRIYFFIVLLFSTCSFVRADTVSHWSLRYNDSLVLYGSQGAAVPELRIAAAHIEALDEFTVRYFRDTPCGECPIEILIENTAGDVVASGEGRGRFSAVRISAYLLLRYDPSRSDRGLLNVYYREGAEEGRRVLLFRIRLV